MKNDIGMKVFKTITMIFMLIVILAIGAFAGIHFTNEAFFGFTIFIGCIGFGTIAYHLYDY